MFVVIFVIFGVFFLGVIRFDNGVDSFFNLLKVIINGMVLLVFFFNLLDKNNLLLDKNNN